MKPDRVAIVGAGASGVMAALHLLRRGVEHVVMIERDEAREPGRGVAYGTQRPEHLLNVTAPRMQVDPDDPDHFARWLVARGGQAGDYAPRRLFGEYLVEQLGALSDRLTMVRQEAVAVQRGGHREQVRLANGETVEADLVVLAPGNLRPATPAPLDPGQLAGFYVEDPWHSELATGLSPDQLVLLIGTGLTAIDAALSLDRLGFRGRILGISRRGLVPRTHARREPADGARTDWPTNARELVSAIRRRSAEIGGQPAIHEVRRVAQGLWRRAAPGERRRFLRHLRPWWDVHRHRIAPAVGARIAAMQDERRLRFVAGRLTEARIDRGRVRLTWRRRGSTSTETMEVDRLVNCTGPELDVDRAAEPLFDALIAAGRMRSDPLRLGAEVDGHLRLVSREGTGCDTLRAIGPITRGQFWEANAVADIGEQAKALAQSVCRRS